MQRHYQHGGASSQPPVHPFQGVAPPRPPEAPLPTDAVDGTRTRSVELFNKEKIIGEGTYGEASGPSDPGPAVALALTHSALGQLFCCAPARASRALDVAVLCAARQC